MKRLCVVLIVALMATGCIGVGGSKKDVIGTEGLQISFIAKRDHTSGINALSGNFHTPQDHEDTLFNREIYREPFNRSEEGMLIGAFTPSSMIISLESIFVEKPGSTATLSLRSEVNSTPDGGWSILPNFDLAYANEIMDASYVITDGDFDYQAVRVTMFTRNSHRGDIRPNQELPFVGEIRVDLGPEYRDVQFENSRGITEDGLHIFEFADLIPLEGREKTTVASMMFVDQVKEPFIINPDGEYVDNFRSTYWETDSRWGHAGYIIYNPGLKLDFRKGNHLVFEYDLVNLIEVYDNGSSDPSEHLVTFRLDNPFPITFYLEERTQQAELPMEVPVKDVEHLEIGYFDLIDRSVVLKWTNPPIETFEQVRIVRLEGEFPSDIDDGEEVYAGRFPVFQDRNVDEGGEYHYRVIVEDCYGNLSKGEIISIRTDPPAVDEIELAMYKNGVQMLVEDPLTMSVGDKIWFSAIGRKEHYSVNIAPKWEVSSGNIISLLYEHGDQNELHALNVGEAKIKGYLPDSFGTKPVMLSIIVEP